MTCGRSNIFPIVRPERLVNGGRATVARLWTVPNPFTSRSVRFVPETFEAPEAKSLRRKATPAGFEPATTRLEGKRSTRKSTHPVKGLPSTAARWSHPGRATGQGITGSPPPVQPALETLVMPFVFQHNIEASLL